MGVQSIAWGLFAQNRVQPVRQGQRGCKRKDGKPSGGALLSAGSTLLPGEVYVGDDFKTCRLTTKGQTQRERRGEEGG